MMSKDVQILHFHPEHFRAMDIRSKETEAVFALPNGFEHFESMAKASVQAATFFYDGRILFCAGFAIPWAGVADFWMVPSIYLKDHPMLFYRIVRRYLKVIPETFKLHRIQTTSYDDPFHEKWMLKLGFKKEGVMRQFRHDKGDMVLYGRIF